MRKEEKKIKEDILKEIKVPDILSKIKPYANEQAAIMQEDNRTVHVNFHKPARVLTACLASVIGVVIVVIIGVSINGTSFMGGNMKDASPADIDNYQNAQSGSNYSEPNPSENYSSDDSSIDFINYYNSNVKNDELEENELLNYYNEICTYVANNKSIDEILAIYETNDSIEHEESIRIIYEYLTK